MNAVTIRNFTKIANFQRHHSCLTIASGSASAMQSSKISCKEYESYFNFKAWFSYVHDPLKACWRTHDPQSLKPAMYLTGFPCFYFILLLSTECRIHVPTVDQACKEGSSRGTSIGDCLLAYMRFSSNVTL